GGRGVIGPPVVAAVGVRRARDGAGGRAAVLEDLVVLDARLIGAGGRSGGRAAGGGLGDTGPAAAVEADAEQQLARRDALRLQLGDRGGRVEAFPRDAVVRRQRRVGSRGAVLVEGAEVVVRHHVVPVEVLGGAAVVGRVDLAAVRAVRGECGGD